MFQILLFSILVTNAFAVSTFSQGHIKYSDSNGSKVDWKLYAPYSQFKSQLNDYQRRDDGKASTEKPKLVEPESFQSPIEIAPKNLEPRYKPFSQVPFHLKQLLRQFYEPQLPYVDPNVFFHRIPVYNENTEMQFSSGDQASSQKFQPLEYQSEPQSAVVRHEEKSSRLRYKEESEVQHRRSSLPVSPTTHSLRFDKSVPLEIQQLLNYQAQIPYNVIANHIIFKPKKPFIPEPFSEDQVGPYRYRSKVYYATGDSVKTNEPQAAPVTKDNNYE